MRNLNELRSFVGATLNGGANVLKDRKLTGDDLQHVIRPALLASDAIDDAGEAFAEAATASNAEMEASAQNFSNELTAFKEEDQYDIEKIEQGIVSVGRLIARARAQGREEGRNEVLATLSPRERQKVASALS